MVRMVYRVPIFFIQDLLKFRFHDIISNTDYTIFFNSVHTLCLTGIDA